ncbi:MAG: FG-GAP-like repeat-containing protein, partial [Reichenbachiella sp.]
MKKYYLTNLIATHLIVFLLSNPMFAQIGVSDFSTVTSITGLTSTNQLELADFDGDGLADLVALDFNNTSSSNVVIYPNTSSESGISFGSAVALSVTHGPLDVKAADLNNDGKLDLVTSNWPANTVGVFFNTSTGSGVFSFGSVQEFSVLTNSQELALEDFDQDGLIDIAVTANTDNSVCIFRNLTVASSSTVSLAARVDIATGIGTRSIATGDLDQDGYPDFVVSNNTANTVQVFRNDATMAGEIAFTSITNYTVSNPIGLVMEDFNGDGFPDVAVCSFDNNESKVYTNNSSGEGNFILGDVVTVSDSYLSPGWLTASDLDNDGAADLIVTNHASSTVSVYRNTSVAGAISFDNSFSYATGTLPRGVKAADLTGNGLIDFAVASYTSGSITTYQNSYVSVGLGAQYDFDEGIATDVSGNGFDGTLIGGVTSIEDRFGKDRAFNFDGSTGYITTTQTFSNNQPLTVSAWVNWNGTGADQVFASWLDNSLTNRMWFGLDGSGNINFGDGFVTSTALTANEWVHLVGVYDGSQSRLYINGVLSDVSTAGLTYQFDVLTIGRQGNNASEYWNGGIDDIKIYNHTITAEEVSSLYDEEVTYGVIVLYDFDGDATDSSDNLIDATLGDGATATTFPILSTDQNEIANQAYSFDGGDYMKIPHDEELNFGLYSDFTFTGRFKSSLTGMILESLDGTSGCYVYLNSGVLTFYTQGAGGTATLSSATNTLIDNIWHHYAISVKRDSGIKLYIDGVLDAESTVVTSVIDISVVSETIIGAYANNVDNSSLGLYFNGSLDDIGIYGDALTVEEIEVLAGVTLSAETDITAFSLTNQTGAATISATNHTIAIEVVNGTTVTALVPTFTVSADATVAVSAVSQVSGTTANDFTSAVTYTVTAEDGVTTQDWVVTVSVHDGLIAQYDFTGDATDSSDNGLDATLGDGATATTFPILSIDRDGVASQAYSFDGGDHMIVPHDDLLNFGTDKDFTFTGWFKTSVTGMILDTYGSNAAGCYLYVQSNGTLYFLVSGSGSSTSIISTTTSLLDDAWHHYAVSVDRVAGMKLYIDGVLDIENATVSNTLDMTNTVDMSIGAYTVTDVSTSLTNYFTGFLDGIRIYNVVLTEEEVVLLADVELSIETDMTSFSFTEEIQTSTIDTDTHTVSISVVNSTVVTALISTFELSAGATATVSAAAQVSGTTTNDFTSAVTYTVTAEDGVTTQDWVVTVNVHDGLIAQYDFTGDATDSSDNGLDATLGDGATATTFPTLSVDRDGVASQAYSFDGGDHMIVPHDDLLNFGTDKDFTFTGWFKTSVTGMILDTYGSNAAGCYIYLTGGTLRLAVFGSGSNVIITSTTASLFDDVWHHYAVSVDRVAGMKLYIDGVLDIENTTASNALDMTNTVDMSIGGYTATDVNTSISNYFTGSLDGIRIYNTALTEEEIVLLADNELSIETDITSFSLTEEIETSTIDTNNHTVSISVVNSTVVTGLIPTFDLSAGATATVSATAQVSGSTANDFTSAVTYTVTAEDGSTTQDWMVMVSIEGASNTAPTVVNAISDQMMILEDTIQLDISNVFLDAEGDVLSYVVSSNDASIVSVNESGQELSLVALGLGEVEITLTASDGSESVSDVFSVTVSNQIVYAPIGGYGTTDGNSGFVTSSIQHPDNTFSAELLVNFQSLPAGTDDWIQLVQTDYWNIQYYNSSEVEEGVLEVYVGDGFGNGISSLDHWVSFNVEELGGINIDEWYQVAFTYDGTTFSTYLNGELRIAEDFAWSNPTGDIELTVLTNTQGFVDELRLWDVVRTVNELQDNIGEELTSTSGMLNYWQFNEFSDNGDGTFDTPDFSANGDDLSFGTGVIIVIEEQLGVPQNLVFDNVINTGFDLNWEEVAGAISYNVLVATDTNFDNIVVDDTVSTHSISVTGLSASTFYYVTVRALDEEKVSEPSNEYEVATLSDVIFGMLGYYTFDGGSLLDYSGNGNDLTLGDGVDTTLEPILTSDRDGVVQEAYYFDGGDYLSINTGTGISITGDLTFSMWVNVEEIEVKRRLLWDSNSSFEYGDFVIFSDGSLAYNYRNGTEDPGATLNSTTAIVASKWQMVSMTRSAGTITFFIDGEEINSAFAHNPVSASIINSIGEGEESYAAGFLGALDEIRMYDNVLSSNDIRAIYELEKSDLPNLSLSNTTIVENNGSGDNIGTIEGGSGNYSLNSGNNNNGMFSINGTSLNAGVVFDYEIIPNPLMVEVVDDESGALGIFEITVVNEEEAPLIEDVTYPNLYTKGSGESITISLLAMDPDGGELVVYIAYSALSEGGVSGAGEVLMNNQSGSSTYSYSITPSEIDALGIEFKIIADDGQSTSETAISRIAVTTMDGDQSMPVSMGNTEEDYSIVAYPYASKSRSVLFDDDLGSYNTDFWRLFHWNGTSYTEQPSSIDPGEGYWLINNLTSNIDLPAGDPVTLNENGDFEMTLRAGQNQIGNPFPYTLDWTAVQEYNGDKIILNDLTTYNGGFDYEYNQSRLSAFEGGFLDVDFAQTIYIPTTAVNVRMIENDGVSNSNGGSLNSDWTFALNLVQGGLHNRVAAVGMNGVSDSGKDRLDVKMFPRLTNYLDVEVAAGMTRDFVEIQS